MNDADYAFYVKAEELVVKLKNIITNNGIEIDSQLAEMCKIYEKRVLHQKEIAHQSSICDAKRTLGMIENDIKKIYQLGGTPTEGLLNREKAAKLALNQLLQFDTSKFLETL